MTYIELIAATIVSGALFLCLSCKQESSDEMGITRIAASDPKVNLVYVGGRLAGVTLRSSEGVKQVLPKLEQVPTIEGLTIGGVPLSDLQLRQIAVLKLKKLTLRGCSIDDDDLCWIGEIDGVSHLHLFEHAITDRGLQHLSMMADLETLELLGTKIHGQGLAHLKSLPKLRDVTLTGSEVDDTGVKACAKLANLKRLGLGQTQVSFEGLKHLSGSHMLCEIIAPDALTIDQALRFRKLHIDAKREARAAGKQVLPDQESPFADYEALKSEMESKE